VEPAEKIEEAEDKKEEEEEYKPPVVSGFAFLTAGA